MRRFLTICIALAALLSPALAADGAVFQYALEFTYKDGRGRDRDSTAFLWIPAEAKQVRGIVISGMTLMEREMSRDPQIREACEDQQLAIVFLKSDLGSADIPKLLSDLARHSGYRELPAAPLFFAGHSAGGPPAKRLAIKMAGRCFGLVQYRGGIAGPNDPVPPGIPTLAMVGQFDEFGGRMRADDREDGPWEGARNGIAAYRAADRGHLASIAVEPGAGHFAWSDRNAAYLAMYIGKAAQARIPKSWPIDADEPIALKKVDPDAGWLTDLTIKAPGKAAPAPVTEYKGDKNYAAWHFDEAMARATIAYHRGITKKDQFIKWNDRYWVDAGTRFFFLGMNWVDDGRTFEVNPVYAEKYPGQYNGNGPRWPEAGQPVGHSDAPIKIKPVSGPIKAVGDRRFRMHFDELAPATESSRVTFMAYSEGDDDYRYTEHVGMMPRGFKGLTKGASQTITFPPIGNLKADTKPVELKATSSAKLPVEYHIGFGPAVIEAGKLRITQIPARANFPIAVKVVAYQFGSGVEPFVKTATPVEQVIAIQKP